MTDYLSDIFVAMRVRKGFYTRLEFSAPWSLCFRGFDHADFGVVTEGNCWLTVDHRPSVLMRAGDGWVLPHGNLHVISDSPETPVVPFADVAGQKVRNVLRYGGPGARTTIVAGNFIFEEKLGSEWLTDLLPPVMIFRKPQDGTSALQKTLQLLNAESERDEPGCGIVMSRLADILFIQAIRAHLASHPSANVGWVRALSDRQIGLAVKSIHDRIDKRWTVEALAAIAGMSRSAFASRFKDVVGEPPMEYLMRWRMQAATQLLEQRALKVADVASHVGYDSEAAFIKMFKRVIGTSPGEYRRRLALAATEGIVTIVAALG